MKTLKPGGATSRADNDCATDLPHFPMPSWSGHEKTVQRGIQRTMQLLATSTPDHKNTVRILFYGQSITEQAWWQIVADDLQTRYPNANLIIENLALGGFASQMLVKTAETDLYPFYPDLMIFRVSGDHERYEDIIRRTRERTTAEIIMQTDHVTKPEDFTEQTDAEALWPPDGKQWAAFMNHRWLPELAVKYGTVLCDQRALWKRYLTDNAFAPEALLSDGTHLNAHGEFLMGEFMKAHLQAAPELGPSAAENWVETYTVGRDLHWQDGRLRLYFRGNRVDVIVTPGSGKPPASVCIDDRRPSDIAELYGFTRALAEPGGKWPVIAPITWQTPLQVEEWTMNVTTVDKDLFDFTVRGSSTGPDGAGRSNRRFVSHSGRVVIEPDAWNVAYALSLSRVTPVPQQFSVTWRAVPWHTDNVGWPATAKPGVETAVTLAQGLPNCSHTLEISGNTNMPITAVRVYTPPLEPGTIP